MSTESEEKKYKAEKEISPNNNNIDNDDLELSEESEILSKKK